VLALICVESRDRVAVGDADDAASQVSSVRGDGRNAERRSDDAGSCG